MKTISFRAQLKGEISDFLNHEHLQCVNTEEGLLELVVALSDYTEEGHPLFPQIILCEDLATTLKVLQCSDPLKIGTGTRTKSTMMDALKKCAPLARDGWVVFLLRNKDSFDYGVFRSSCLPTAVDVKTSLQDLVGVAGSPQMVLATQLADKAVELVGTCTGVLDIYFSARPSDAVSPSKTIDDILLLPVALIRLRDTENRLRASSATLFQVEYVTATAH